jgi:hypothetical protein
MDEKKTIEYTIIGIIAVALLIFAWEFSQYDVRFCRSALDGLVKGAIKVERLIDWEKLEALGIDVGANYRRFTNPQDKETYRRLFIRNFAVGFQKGEGDFKKFTNWRVLLRKGAKVVVAADYLLYNKTVLFTLFKSSKTKLIAIEWKE